MPLLLLAKLPMLLVLPLLLTLLLLSITLAISDSAVAAVNAAVAADTADAAIAGDAAVVADGCVALSDTDAYVNVAATRDHDHYDHGSYYTMSLEWDPVLAPGTVIIKPGAEADDCSQV